MIDKDCYYHCSGGCLKGLLGTKCEVKGCVAKIETFLGLPEIEERRLELSSQKMVDAVEKYLKQQCLRSELVFKLKELKKVLENRDKNKQ